MKRLLLGTLMVLASASVQTLAPASALASGDHNHEAATEPAPKGGILRDAPPFKVELVLDGDNAKIFVWQKDPKDSELKPASLDTDTIVGQVAFRNQKKHTKVSFKKSGESYDATIKGIGKAHRYDLHVDLVKDGKKILADFGVDNIH